ncbi:MAG: YkgJ family cysteine cluster protein [Bacteroidia bacterium]|nr:YkgJ family cysteine cluster protein [Bacteroidia bacterium]
MDCREDCGACCIAISISSPIPGMPEGKPAGLKCIHLLDDNKCALYGDRIRPKVCVNFKPEPEFCGNSREEALRILTSLSDDPPPPLKVRTPAASQHPLKGV